MINLNTIIFQFSTLKYFLLAAGRITVNFVGQSTNIFIHTIPKHFQTFSNISTLFIASHLIRTFSPPHFNSPFFTPFPRFSIGSETDKFSVHFVFNS